MKHTAFIKSAQSSISAGVVASKESSLIRLSQLQKKFSNFQFDQSIPSHDANMNKKSTIGKASLSFEIKSLKSLKDQNIRTTILLIIKDKYKEKLEMDKSGICM